MFTLDDTSRRSRRESRPTPVETLTNTPLESASKTYDNTISFEQKQTQENSHE